MIKARMLTMPPLTDNSYAKSACYHDIFLCADDIILQTFCRYAFTVIAIIAANYASVA